MRKKFSVNINGVSDFNVATSKRLIPTENDCMAGKPPGDHQPDTGSDRAIEDEACELARTRRENVLRAVATVPVATQKQATAFVAIAEDVDYLCREYKKTSNSIHANRASRKYHNIHVSLYKTLEDPEMTTSLLGPYCTDVRNMHLYIHEKHEAYKKRKRERSALQSNKKARTS